MCVCVWISYVNVCACAQRPQINLGYHSLGPALLVFEAGSLIGLELLDSARLLAREPPVFASPLLG